MARKTAKVFPDLPWLVEKARAFQALTTEEKETILKTGAMPDDPLLRTVVAYVKADAEAEVAYEALDALRLHDRRDSGLAKGFIREQFDVALHDSERKQHMLARAVDAWQQTAKLVLAQEAHATDPANSNVPKEDAKTLIAEALSESAVELQWNVKSVGLVAHKLSEAVYGFVVREEAQEPSLCEACR